MEPTIININDLTVEKIKALLYDEIVKLESAQRNIEGLKRILEKKIEEEQSVEPEFAQEKTEEPTEATNLEE